MIFIRSIFSACVRVGYSPLSVMNTKANRHGHRHPHYYFLCVYACVCVWVCSVPIQGKEKASHHCVEHERKKKNHHHKFRGSFSCGVYSAIFILYRSGDERVYPATQQKKRRAW